MQAQTIFADGADTISIADGAAADGNQVRVMDSTGTTTYLTNSSTTATTYTAANSTSYVVQADAGTGYVFSSWTNTKGQAGAYGTCVSGTTANPCIVSFQTGASNPLYTANYTTASTVIPANSMVSASPSSVTADGVTTSTVTVTLKDANGNGVSYKTVSLGQGAGSSTITTVTGTTGANGVATFTVKDTKAETVTYTATDTTDSVNVTQTVQVAFTPGPASKLVFTTQPNGGTGGVSWTSQPVVTVQDANGNTVTSSVAGINFAIGINPGSGSLSCSVNPQNASSGVDAFSGCAINKAGTGYTLTVASTGLTGAPAAPSISPPARHPGWSSPSSRPQA